MSHSGQRLSQGSRPGLREGWIILSLPWRESVVTVVMERAMMRLVRRSQGAGRVGT